MKPKFFQSCVVSLAAIALASCSGLPKGTTSGGGNATVSFTFVADTLPPNPSILSYQVNISSLTLTPASGTPITLSFNSPPALDLMRLQSDSFFLGSLANVPSGSYTVSVAMTSGQLTFLNDTTATLQGCAVNAICSFNPGAAGAPQITTSVTINSNGKQGIGLDFNLKNSISIASGNLMVNFSNTGTNNVLSDFTLPHTNSNLASGQLDLIEDFTGVVSLSGQTVIITSSIPARGTLTATAATSTNFDPDPSGTLCPKGTASLSGCVSNNQVASVDAILNSDGTLTIQEIEPLLPSPQRDIVEGTVTSITASSLTQFVIVVTDKPSAAAANSLIGPLHVGDLLTVNLPASPSFLVDTKGLAVPPGNLGLFANATNTSVLRPGQTVAVHVTTFTAASGNVPASVTVDTAILRWSRFTAGLSTESANTFTVTGLPSYFGFPSSNSFVVQAFTGTQGADGVTNLDGIASASIANLDNTKPVSVRALFLENSGNTANPAFFAAKVRQH